MSPQDGVELKVQSVSTCLSPLVMVSLALQPSFQTRFLLLCFLLLRLSLGSYLLHKLD